MKLQRRKTINYFMNKDAFVSSHIFFNPPRIFL